MVTSKTFLKIFIVLTFLYSCRSSHSNYQSISSVVNTKWIDTTDVLKNSFVGIYVEDRQDGRILMDYNSTKNFIPASNMKLLTWYASMQLLPKLLPGLYYKEIKDTLFFMGAGNPSFLYKGDSTMFYFLKNHPAKKLVYSEQNFNDNNLGKGWAWEDLSYKFCAEKSALPLYENLLSISEFKILPEYFRSNITKTFHPEFNRKWNKNLFFWDTTINKTQFTPFLTDPEITIGILSNLIHKDIEYRKSIGNYNWNTLNAFSRDSLLKIMLLDSDNFLAEQTLLMISGVLDSVYHELNTEKTINGLLKTEWKDYPNLPRWVDGSGLSRYNLASPKLMVDCLKKIAKDIKNDEILYDYLPKSNQTGTLKNVTQYPFSVYAKTGTLSNNQALSGFLTTKSGKKLVFSIMINHFLSKSNVIQEQIGKILYQLYEYK